MQYETIGAVLGLLEAALAGGPALLATTRDAPGGADRILVVDGSARHGLVGREMRVPPGLIADMPVLLAAGVTRLPLAWTLACGDRPAGLAAAPVSGSPFHLVAACCAEAGLALVVDAADVIAQLLATGQQTSAQSDLARRVNVLVRNLPIPLLFVDAHGAQAFVNDQARRLLGLADAVPPAQAIAAALARMMQADGNSDAQRDLGADPRATLAFEITRDERIHNVESRWIDDDTLSGRLWLFADVTEAKNLQAELAQMAVEDPLTKVLNRRAFESLIATEVDRARRDGSSFALLVFDLDHFKAVNDTYGHQGGDRVLQEVCHAIGGRLRPYDALARIGGEEFAVLLPRTTLDDAFGLAEYLCQVVRSTEILHGERMIRVTCSIGVSVHLNPGDTAAAMMERSDAALYHAKHEGRDCVVTFDDTGDDAGLSAARA